MNAPDFADEVNSTSSRGLDPRRPDSPYTVDIFHTKVRVAFGHGLTAYGDDGESACYPRPGYQFSQRLRGESVGTLDVKEMTDNAVARVLVDPTFCAKAAAQFRSNRE